MSVQSSGCSQQSCADSASATSSRASADGVGRCNSPDGRMTVLSGPGAAPASRSAQPARAAASATSETCGHTSSASSRSAALSRSLASRLTRLLHGTAGSTGSRMTWEQRATPSGRRYFRLRLSARLTCESGCTLWPTPTVASAHRNSAEWGPGLLEAAWSMASGHPPKEFHAKAGRAARLNPVFVLWLMGFPATWASCGERAMRSFRSRPPRS